MATGDGGIKQFVQLVQELFLKGKLPCWVIPQSFTAFRVQDAKYPGAENYGCPEQFEKLGRFNDLEMKIGIWYGAEHPSGALAETFGRLRPKDKKGLGIVLNVTDLDDKKMCTVETTRELRLLDLKLCLSKLGRTLDEVTGPDYTLTQALVAAVARLPGNPFDGIAYESRHHPDGRKCFALWTASGETTTVKTVEMTKLSEFEFTGELPEDFVGDSIDAEEILTEILGYKVLSS